MLQNRGVLFLTDSRGILDLGNRAQPGSSSSKLALAVRAALSFRLLGVFTFVIVLPCST